MGSRLFDGVGVFLMVWGWFGDVGWEMLDGRRCNATSLRYFCVLRNWFSDQLGIFFAFIVLRAVETLHCNVSCTVVCAAKLF